MAQQPNEPQRIRGWTAEIDPTTGNVVYTLNYGRRPGETPKEPHYYRKKFIVYRALLFKLLDYMGKINTFLEKVGFFEKKPGDDTMEGSMTDREYEELKAFVRELATSTKNDRAMAKGAPDYSDLWRNTFGMNDWIEDMQELPWAQQAPTNKTSESVYRGFMIKVYNRATTITKTNLSKSFKSDMELFNKGYIKRFLDPWTEYLDGAYPFLIKVNEYEVPFGKYLEFVERYADYVIEYAQVGQLEPGDPTHYFPGPIPG
jgi:hypothetical protein